MFLGWRAQFSRRSGTRKVRRFTGLQRFGSDRSNRIRQMIAPDITVSANTHYLSKGQSLSMMEHYAGFLASLYRTVRYEVRQPVSVDDNVPGCPPRPSGYVRCQSRNARDQRGTPRRRHGPAMGS